MIAHVVVCGSATTLGADAVTQQRAQLLRGGLQRAGLGRFGFGAYKQFVEPLSLTERRHWDLLLESGVVMQERRTDVNAYDDLDRLTAAFRDDDLIVCSEEQAATLGVPALADEDRSPQVAGLGSVGDRSALQKAEDSQPGMLEPGQDAWDLIDTPAIRRLIAFASQISLLDQHLLGGGTGCRGCRRLLELQSRIPPRRTGSRSVCVITAHPDRQNPIPPTSMDARTWLRRLGLLPVPAHVTTVQLLVRPFSQTRQALHDRQVRVGGRVFDIGHGLDRLDIPGPKSERTTFHVGNAPSLRRFEEEQNVNAEWRIEFYDGVWSLVTASGAEEDLRI